MKKLLSLFAFITLCACSSDPDSAPAPTENPTTNPVEDSNFKYLALGDSYTIGESVCANCRFPKQLRDSLQLAFPQKNVSVNIIAQTGWTTTNLLAAINAQNPPNDYDLVTLLIGVNNQYQQKPFSLYQTEFSQLLAKAIYHAGGDPSNVIVVSIPDYAYTPFGQGTSNPSQISTQIDQYNNYAQQQAEQQNIEFITITDITREGLDNPALVANDGLHPSETAYTEFVKRLRPVAQSILAD